MSVVMSKNKPGRPKSSTPPREKILAMRLPVEVEAALAAFIAGQKFPPTATAVGLRALEDFLRKEGFYPPPPKGK
jgi:hypothetical protein